jgi:hypothetical protein
MIECGHVLPEPGKEKERFEALPSSLQEYLAALGTNKDVEQRPTDGPA